MNSYRPHNNYLQCSNFVCRVPQFHWLHNIYLARLSTYLPVFLQEGLSIQGRWVDLFDIIHLFCSGLQWAANIFFLKLMLPTYAKGFPCYRTSLPLGCITVCTPAVFRTHTINKAYETLGSAKVTASLKVLHTTLFYIRIGDAFN